MHNSRSLSLTLLTFLLITQNILPQVVPSGCCLTIIGPTTITQPGNYRIGQDINGDIIIDADNVVIAGENKVINGGISTTGHSCIKINNVIIQNSSTSGILFDNCSNVAVNETELTSNVTAISISDSNDILIEKVLAKANAASGVSVSSSSGVVVRKVVLQGNGLDGICFQDSSEVDLFLVEADANVQHGLHMINTTRAKTQECGLTNNGNAGLFLDNTNCKVLRNNFVSNNNYGIRITNNSNQVIAALNWAIDNLIMGIEAIQSPTLSFLGNDITGSPTGCFFDECDDSLIQSNNSSNNEVDGWEIRASRNLAILCNTFAGNSSCGLRVSTPDGSAVMNKNNAFFNNIGIDVGGNTAINNIAMNNLSEDFVAPSGGDVFAVATPFTTLTTAFNMDL